MIQTIVTFAVGFLACLFGALWLFKARRRSIDEREDYLALHGKLQKIGLHRISNMIAQLATGDRMECNKLMKAFEREMLEADPLWKFWSPTFYALLDEHCENDWETLQQTLGEIMRTKGKRWKIEFVEVAESGLELKQNAGVTVGATGNQPASVGVMGSTVTEVNNASARNIVQQQAQIAATTQQNVPIQQGSAAIRDPNVSMGTMMNPEQLELLDTIQNGNPMDPQVVEAKKKLMLSKAMN